MSFGLSIDGANQRILIDESHPGIFFKGKYTQAYGASGVTITGCSTMPLVFVKTLGTGYKTNIPQMVNNGNNSWTVTAKAFSDSSLLVYTGDIELYVFDILGASDNVTSGYGMNVYDENSQAIFTTNKKLLKISGYHVTSAVQNTGSEFDIATQTLTSGTIPTTYAVACGAIGLSWVYVSQFTSLVCTVGVRRLTSTTMKFGIGGIAAQFRPAPYTQNEIRANHHLMFINHSDYD